MTDRELEQLEKDAKRPNRGAKYYSPAVVLALIEELKKARVSQEQRELFPPALSCSVCGKTLNSYEMHRCYD